MCIYGVSYVRQNEIYAAQPSVPEPSSFLVEMATVKLHRYNSIGVGQIPTEFIQARGRTIRTEILKSINSIWNKEEWPQQWKESMIVSAYKMGDKTDNQ